MFLLPLAIDEMDPCAVRENVMSCRVYCFHRSLYSVPTMFNNQRVHLTGWIIPGAVGSLADKPPAITSACS
jgi:hypothetical protein